MWYFCSTNTITNTDNMSNIFILSIYYQAISKMIAILGVGNCNRDWNLFTVFSFETYWLMPIRTVCALFFSHTTDLHLQYWFSHSFKCNCHGSAIEFYQNFCIALISLFYITYRRDKARVVIYTNTTVYALSKI